MEATSYPHVGLTLRGCTIEGVITGGPADLAELQPSQRVVAVNESIVTGDKIGHHIAQCDVPGTILRLDVVQELGRGRLAAARRRFSQVNSQSTIAACHPRRERFRTEHSALLEPWCLRAVSRQQLAQELHSPPPERVRRLSVPEASAERATSVQVVSVPAGETEELAALWAAVEKAIGVEEGMLQRWGATKTGVVRDVEDCVRRLRMSAAEAHRRLFLLEGGRWRGRDDETRAVDGRLDPEREGRRGGAGPRRGDGRRGRSEEREGGEGDGARRWGFGQGARERVLKEELLQTVIEQLEKRQERGREAEERLRRAREETERLKEEVESLRAEVEAGKAREEGMGRELRQWREGEEREAARKREKEAEDRAGRAGARLRAVEGALLGGPGRTGADVGLRVGRGKGGIVVKEVRAGGAAERSGVVGKGDAVETVEGRGVGGMEAEEVGRRLRGQAGTRVRVGGRCRGTGARWEVVLAREVAGVGEGREGEAGMEELAARLCTEAKRLQARVKAGEEAQRERERKEGAERRERGVAVRRAMQRAAEEREEGERRRRAAAREREQRVAATDTAVQEAEAAVMSGALERGEEERRGREQRAALRVERRRRAEQERLEATVREERARRGEAWSVVARWEEEGREWEDAMRRGEERERALEEEVKRLRVRGAALECEAEAEREARERGEAQERVEGRLAEEVAVLQAQLRFKADVVRESVGRLAAMEAGVEGLEREVKGLAAAREGERGEKEGLRELLAHLRTQALLLRVQLLQAPEEPSLPFPAPPAPTPPTSAAPEAAPVSQQLRARASDSSSWSSGPPSRRALLVA